MAVSPIDNSDKAIEIRRIYERSELQLLQIIAKALKDGKDGPDWAMQKLGQVSGLLRQMRTVTGKLNKDIPKEIEKLIELAYLEGNKSAESDLRSILEQFANDPEGLPENIQMQLFPDGFPDNKIDVDATMAAMSGVNTGAVAALAGAATTTLTDLHVPIVRAADDIYRRVVAEAAGATLVGSQTRLEVAQTVLNRFTQNGIKVFRAGNRNYDIITYGEMATRSAIGQASLQGHMDQMQGYGFDLVQISEHAEECELCRPWEGQVLSASGNDSRYKSLRDATSAGLFHPNCGHRANTYFEGLTEPITKETEDPEGYEIRKKQRYLERGVRQWKVRRAVALTPEEEAHTAEKVGEWENRLEELTTENNRRRKREREQNIKAR